MRLKILLVTGVLLLLGSGLAQRLSVGFIPWERQETFAEDVQPFIDYLMEMTGLEIRSFVSTDYTGLVEAMGAGQVDLGFFTPFAFYLGHELFGLEAIALPLFDYQDEGKYTATYRAKIIVRGDAGLETLEDLRGKAVGMVDPASASGYLFPGATLKAAGIDLDRDVRVVFLGSHDNVVRAVYSGDVVAGTVYEGVLEIMVDEFPDVYEAIRPLHFSDPIPNGAAAVRPELDEAVMKQLQEALFALGETAEGLRLIKLAFGPSAGGFAPTSMADFEIIRLTRELMNLD